MLGKAIRKLASNPATSKTPRTKITILRNTNRNFLSKMSHQYPNNAPNQTTAIDFEVKLLPRTIRWDGRADAFALSAHRLGWTAEQIRKELCMNGYAAFMVEVLESLNRQPVQLITWAAEPGSNTLLLDPWTDEFTMAAYQIGQTPAQVLAGLNRAGYEATIEDVLATLHVRGMHTVVMD